MTFLLCMAGLIMGQLASRLRGYHPNGYRA